jgi:hypothetical protein
MRAAPNGLRSRFGHESASDDSPAKTLGRARNPRLVGDRVVADLHFIDAAFDGPHGNLAG